MINIKLFNVNIENYQFLEKIFRLLKENLPERF